MYNNIDRSNTDFEIFIIGTGHMLLKIEEIDIEFFIFLSSHTCITFINEKHVCFK